MSQSQLPLLTRTDTIIENDWYIENENLKGLHVTLLGAPYIISSMDHYARLMCSLCNNHFDCKKVKRFYIEYHWEQSGGIPYSTNALLCSKCYLLCIDLLEQELPDCKEPEPEE